MSDARCMWFPVARIAKDRARGTSRRFGPRRMQHPPAGGRTVAKPVVSESAHRLCRPATRIRRRTSLRMPSVCRCRRHSYRTNCRRYLSGRSFFLRYRHSMQSGFRTAFTAISIIFVGAGSFLLRDKRGRPILSGRFCDRSFDQAAEKDDRGGLPLAGITINSSATM